MAARAMAGLRLGGSYLQPRVGALETGGCGWGSGRARCAWPGTRRPAWYSSGSLALCPGLAAERAVMLGKLEAVYPGFGAACTAMLPAGCEGRGAALHGP